MPQIIETKLERMQMMKSNDFEVHSIGTTEELRLSRALAREIEAVLEQPVTPGQWYADAIPYSVLNRYYDLRALYQRQMEEGVDL
jgi:hypothetical protein